MLFEASFIELFSILAAQLNTVLNDDSPITNKISRFTNTYSVFISNHPFLPNFIIQELNRNPEFIKIINQKLPSIEKFKKQVEHEVKQGVLIPINSEQLFINIMSLIIFPFMASPLLKGYINYNEKAYEDLLETRKTEVANFIINSIKRK